MTTGRKPKPTALKLVTGNPGKRQLNDAEPKPVVPKQVKTPDELDEYGQRAWRRNLPKLKRMGLFTEADADMLMCYCDAYSQWCHALDQMRRLDKMDTDDFETDEEKEQAKKEFPKIWRDVQITREKARTDMRLFAAELGLSASARSRMSVGKEEQPVSRMEALLDRRRA